MSSSPTQIQQPSTIPALPPEILCQILQHLNHIDQDQPNYTLSSALTTIKHRPLFDAAWHLGCRGDLTIFNVLRVCKLWRSIVLEDVLRVGKVQDWERKLRLFEEVALYAKERKDAGKVGFEERRDCRGGEWVFGEIGWER